MIAIKALHYEIVYYAFLNKISALYHLKVISYYI